MLIASLIFIALVVLKEGIGFALYSAALRRAGEYAATLNGNMAFNCRANIRACEVLAMTCGKPHYEPKTETVYLPLKMYWSCKLHNVLMALHEEGHALQHQRNAWLFNAWPRLLAARKAWPLIAALLAAIGTTAGIPLIHLIIYAVAIQLAIHTAAGLTKFFMEIDASALAMRKVPAEYEDQARKFYSYIGALYACNPFSNPW